MGRRILVHLTLRSNSRHVYNRDKQSYKAYNRDHRHSNHKPKHSQFIEKGFKKTRNVKLIGVLLLFFIYPYPRPKRYITICQHSRQ